MSRLNICLVSDFFCPNTGGVETHIYHLAQFLLARGHKVVVITHSYGKRRGVRLLSNDLKVFYLPLVVFYNGCILPTVFATLPILRHIFITEEIQIVHGHSFFSCLAHEAMFHSQAMGIRTVFTDHSLFGFADLSSILTNKLLQFSLTNCTQVICVSHTSKENTVLRGHLSPELVSVIPNAVDCSRFTPEPIRSEMDSTETDNKITIVVVSRLVYRKGTDLLVSLIPQICAQHPDVNFLIAGDGPKRIPLEELREKFGLQERIELLGVIPHSTVRGVLCRGQIFLNTSLTEAFCMAIVEAASCGLLVVSTDVGGVPEVLPGDLIYLAEPTVEALFQSVNTAILRCSRKGFGDPLERHNRVVKMYCWPDITSRTEVVYSRAMATPNRKLSSRLKRYFHCGVVLGLFFLLLATINLAFLSFLDLVSETKRGHKSVKRVSSQGNNSAPTELNFFTPSQQDVISGR